MSEGEINRNGLFLWVVCHWEAEDHAQQMILDRGHIIRQRLPVYVRNSVIIEWEKG